MEAWCWVDEHVKLMQNEVGRQEVREGFEDCSGLLVYLLDLVTVGIRSGMGDLRTEETD